MTRALVIGGGVSGLATASLLAHGGLDVTVLERHDALGGRSSSLSTKGYSLDLGPQWLLAPELAERFFDLVGKTLDGYVSLESLEPRFRCFFEGLGVDSADTWDAPSDTSALLEEIDTFSRGDGDGARLYLARAARNYLRVLESFAYSTYDGARGEFARDVLRGVPTLAASLVATIDRRIARAVHHPRSRQLLSFPAVPLAGSPSRLPYGYAYLSHLTLAQNAVCPRGGMVAFVEALAALARDLGATVRTDADVARILVDPHSRLATGVILHGGELVAADVVVSSVDLHRTETALLSREFRTWPEEAWRKMTPSPSALVAAFSVKRAVPALARHNLFFPRQWEATLAGLSEPRAGSFPSPTFLHVSRPSATDPKAAPRGKDALVITAPMPADPDLGSTDESRAELERYAHDSLAQVSAWAGVPDLVERSRLLDLVTPADLHSRYGAWRGSAMGLAHVRNQSAVLRPRNVSRRVRNLVYVGSSTLPGAGVTAGLVSAELVAKYLLVDRSARPLATPADERFLVDASRLVSWRDLAGTDESV